jgi:hypothetical protein
MVYINCIAEYPYIHIHITYIHIHTYINTHMRQLDTHTYIHTHKHAYTHTYTQEDIMVYINCIAEYLHKSVHENEGFPNKNIGYVHVLMCACMYTC